MLQPVPRRLIWNALKHDRSTLATYLEGSKTSIPIPIASRTGPDAERVLVVRDQLEQAAIWVAEVDARPLAARTPALHRAKLDLHVVGSQMTYRALDRPRPGEAEIAPARLYRNPRERLRFDAGRVDIELLLAEVVCRHTVRVTDELRAEDVAIEGV